MKRVTGIALAVVAAFALGAMALHRQEPISSLWIVSAAVCV